MLIRIANEKIQQMKYFRNCSPGNINHNQRGIKGQL